MEHWYALHTKPHSEYRVRATLQRKEIETYLPEVTVPQTDNQQRSAPFFPCYLFMRVDMEKISSTQWQWTPGLRRIVSTGKDPQPVPEQAIDLIRRKLAEINSQGGLPKHRFRPGETVRIAEGPFSGMHAIFEKATSSQERVQVLLSFLGRLNRIKIETYALEKAPTNAQLAKPKNRRRTRGRGRRIK